MMNNRRRNQKGLVMLAVMFLVALLVPLIYMGTYFRLSTQRESFERSIQDRQLYWALIATINQTKAQLETAVSQYRLDGTDINGSPIFAALNRVSILDTPMNSWLNTYKNNFSTFLSSHNYTHAGSAAVSNVELITGSECTRCFAYVNSNDGLAATFTLEARVRFPEIDMTGAIRQMRQSLFVSTSNLADFAIFYFNNFDTSPGTDTLYQGPIYIGKKANLTPNQGTTLTLSFKEGDPGAYALKANQIYWFANRDLGCDPYNPSNCTRHQDTNEFLAGSYEKDQDGSPVFYYYNSNNSPGWVDGPDAGTNLDQAEKSTIQVKDNNSANFNNQSDEHFTKLISSVDGEIPAPTDRRYFYRGDGGLKLRSTTYVETEKIGPTQDGSIVHTTLAFDGSNPLTQFINPGWQDFIENHFEKSDGSMLFEDNTPTITLQLGGATNPHEIINLAADSDTLSEKRVKLHWLARDYDPDKYYGLAIDFSRMFCGCPDKYGPTSQCGNGSIPQVQCDINNTAGTFNNEDPLLWHSSVVNDGFISFDGVSIPQSIFVPIFTGDSFPSNPYFKDMRTDRRLQVIIVDVNQLKHLIEHGSNAPEYAGTVFEGQGQNTREKPFLLYIGLSSLYQTNVAIRLINADSLPKNGLTIATNGFVQIEGNYNAEAPESGSLPEQNGCEMKPAAILADQVMALSNSWQDWPGDPNLNVSAPATYFDPSDNKLYSSPLNPPPANTPYYINDFRSHPIRCNASNGQPCSDVNVNAMILAGNVPNRLMPTLDYEALGTTVNELGIPSTNFNVEYLSNQTMDYQSSWQRANVRVINYQASSGGDAYINENAIKYENFGAMCAQTYENSGNPIDPTFNNCVGALAFNPTCTSPNAQHRQIIQNCIAAGGSYVNNAVQPACNPASSNFAQCAQACGVSPYCIVNQCATLNPQGVQSCMTDNYRNIPVKMINAYSEADDTAIRTPSGTVASNFLDGNCPSCNGDIPLYLKVDSAGTIPTSNMENNHIKPYDSNNPGNFDTLMRLNGSPNSFLRPGTRYAGLLTYGRGWSTQLLPYHYFEAQNSGGSCGCYSGGAACSATVIGQYNCNNNPEQCGTWCPDCPQGVCGGSGEGCNVSECNPNTCNSITQCPSECSSSNCSPTYAVRAYIPDPIGTYTSRPVVEYGKGGIRRLIYSNNLNDSGYQVWKRQFLYMPAQQPLYNGGFENLIRYNENWNQWDCDCSGNSCSNCIEQVDKNQITFLGTAHALWTSETLIKSNGTPAHWISTTYNAPERNFLYATTLKNDFCKPPGIPSGVILRVEGQDQQ